MDRPQPIRALVVDDEPLAREGIRLLLEGDPEVAVAGECGTGRDAVAAVMQLRPDLLFLDVQMPEMNGFEVVAALEPAQLPVVVFVTAYDRYALRAFEVHALDYLLKPFSDERFHDALRRAKQHLCLSRMTDLSQRLLSLLASHGATGEPPLAPAASPLRPPYLSRIAIRDVGRVVFLRMDEIDWIEAADYYVQIHAGNKSYLHRETMSCLEERLDPERFLRVHRSAIVNRDRIKELRTQGRRDLMVV